MAVEAWVDWLVRHTYVVVLLGTMVDATGLPFPGRVLLIAAGAFARRGDVNPALVVVLAAAGAALTDHVWYLAGASGRSRLLRLYCRLSLSSGRCVRRTGDWFRRYGGATIVVGRFVAGVRIFAWPLAREHGIGYPTFLALDLLGALLWAGTWVGLGMAIGDGWVEAAEDSWWIVPGLLVAVVVPVLGVRLYRRLRYGAALV
ncbi:MAG TPA: VTT domain-containing protein [Candidatus Tectomicrobia bacterium]|nr:VTT domain-containing protein [Candidatus Tectomicrobia bacterium]